MTRQINVGGVLIGGGAPVTIQSMTNTPTQDVAATLRQIRELAAAGCEIVRVAVPDMEAAWAVGKIKESSPIPVVVDIHFDYKLALEAIAAGADKVRINPRIWRRSSSETARTGRRSAPGRTPGPRPGRAGGAGSSPLG